MLKIYACLFIQAIFLKGAFCNRTDTTSNSRIFLGVGYGTESILNTSLNKNMVGYNVTLNTIHKIKLNRRFELRNGLNLKYRSINNYKSKIFDYKYSTPLDLTTSFNHYIIEVSSSIQWKYKNVSFGLGVIPSFLMVGTFEQYSSGPDFKYNGLYNIKKQEHVAFFNKVNMAVSFNIDYHISKRLMVSFVSSNDLIVNPLTSQFGTYSLFTNAISFAHQLY